MMLLAIEDQIIIVYGQNNYSIYFKIYKFNLYILFGEDDYGQLLKCKQFIKYNLNYE